jgi:hypothetical protein
VHDVECETRGEKEGVVAGEDGEEEDREGR